MLKQKTKTIEVGSKNYQLNKMDARTGSYVAFKLASVLAPLLNSNSSATNIGAALMGMPRQDFDELQNLLLQTVNHLVDGSNGQQIPEPVLTAKGDFVDPELAYDAVAVIQLTAQAAEFNIGGFFTEAGLKLPAQN